MSLTHTALDSRIMIVRSVRRSVRDPEAFFTALMLPVILMLLFVYVFGGAMRTGSAAYVDYVVPGLIVLCSGFGAGTTAVAVANDMSNGIIDRFRSMPLAPSSVLVGHVVASLARNLVATTLVVLVGLAIGWRPSGSAADWVAALLVVALFVLAMSWLAAGVGLLARSPEAANSATIVLMFLPYVSTAFVPVDTMPAWLRGFAAHQPLTPVIESLRGLWSGTPRVDDLVTAMAWCAGILVVAMAVGATQFRRRTNG